MQKMNQAPATTTRDPFQTLWSRLFGDTLQEFYGPQEAQLAPRMNVAEHEGAYEISFELPGLAEENIQVHMQDHVLSVTAERKDERETQGKRWHRVEHRYGQFTRSISLPQDASANGIEAVYKQGVLTVKVQKAPESRPTRVQVKTG